MRNSLQPRYEVRNTPAESFGRIARRTALGTAVLLAPAHSSANEADIASGDEGEALDQRAPAANDFGGTAPTGSGDGHAYARLGTQRAASFGVQGGEQAHPLSAMQLAAAARTERSRLVAGLAATAFAAVASRLGQLVARARQRRQARATYLALSRLDARTLRDIGLHRSEILSVAAELGGDFEATRVQALHVRRGR